MAEGEDFCGPECHDFLLDSMLPDRDLDGEEPETVMQGLVPGGCGGVRSSVCGCFVLVCPS